jgi:hypothetical protein
MRYRRALASLATAAFVLSVPTAGQAATTRRAVATQPGATTGALHVTLALRPADAARLASLATTPHRPGTARRNDLQAVRPAATTLARARTELGRLGLQVERSTAWTVTASGPATTVTRLFGSARAERPGARFAQPLPRVPQSLRPFVRAALGGDDTRPAVSRRVALSGAQLRSAYASPPPAALGSGPQTVATLQFSGWDETQLATYARTVYGRSLPAGLYTSVSVDGADVTAADGEGDVEVALDQESLLAVAPGVRQRAYIAPNSIAGFVDALHQVASDAAASSIVALSISWGACESGPYGWGTPARVAVDEALAEVLNAGVTVFAASGDWGGDDCGDSSQSVDFPASSPFVVGVGGTTLNGADPSWTETAWSGSGGGDSAVYRKPSWQAGLCVPGTQRVVPDISAVADPATGFSVYATDHPSSSAAWYDVGGTSLASPVSAGAFATTLASRGITSGVGDIHPALYAAAPTAFRDVTAGSNGQHGVLGFRAAPGYDAVTGLGSPQWDALGAVLTGASSVRACSYSPSPVPLALRSAPGTTQWRAGTGMPPSECPTSGYAGAPPASYGAATEGTTPVWVALRDAADTCSLLTGSTVVDATSPTVAGRAGIALPASTVSLSWPGADAHGIAKYDVSVRRVYTSSAPVTSFATTSSSMRLSSGRGWTYYLTARSWDRAGNPSALSTAYTAVPFDDADTSLSTGWDRRSSASAYLGGFRGSGIRGATAARKAWGKTYYVIIVKGGYGGRFDVLVDGRVAAVGDCYAATNTYRSFVRAASFSTAGYHTVSVRVRGDHQPASGGTRVYVDGIDAVN